MLHNWPNVPESGSYRCDSGLITIVPHQAIRGAQQQLFSELATKAALGNELREATCGPKQSIIASTFRRVNDD
jgi:hypothetical protein